MGADQTFDLGGGPLRLEQFEFGDSAKDGVLKTLDGGVARIDVVLLQVLKSL